MKTGLGCCFQEMSWASTLTRLARPLSRVLYSVRPSDRLCGGAQSHRSHRPQIDRTTCQEQHGQDAATTNSPSFLSLNNPIYHETVIVKMLRRGRQNEQEAVENSDSNGSAHLKTASSAITGAPRKAPLLLLVILVISCFILPRDRETDQSERPIKVTDKLPPPTATIATDKHLFDCDHVNATCHYFRPLPFFQHGKGQSYLSTLTEMGADSVNLPRMTHFSRGTN